MFDKLFLYKVSKLILNKIVTYRYTSLMTSFGVVVIVFINLTKINIIYILISTLVKVNQLNVEKFLILFFCISTGYILDLHKKKAGDLKELELKNQSYSIFKATMESLNDLMSNYIQSVQLYRLEMDEMGDPLLNKELDDVTQALLINLRELEISEEVKVEKLFTNLSTLNNKLEKVH